MRSAPDVARRAGHRRAGRPGGRRHRDDAVGIGRLQCFAQSPDERAVGRHENRVEQLDVDVDAVDADAIGKRDEPRDRRVLDLERSEQALVARRPEAGVGELDGHVAVVRLADELLADRAGDPLVPGLARVDLAGPGVGDREEGEGRQRRLREMVGDVAVHLPVRHVSVELVLRKRTRGRLRCGRRRGDRLGRCAVCGRAIGGTRVDRAGRRGRRSQGVHEGDRDDGRDGNEADHGPSGHGASVGPLGNPVKSAGQAAGNRTPEDRRSRRQGGGRHPRSEGPPASCGGETFVSSLSPLRRH